MSKPSVVWVVVLGDFGRSPRMQYHTWSLSSEGYDVHVLGSPGSAPIQELQCRTNVHIHAVQPPPLFIDKLPTVLSLLAKVVFQIMVMLWLMLAKLPRPSAIVMQNPPAIPVMMLCWLASLRHGASLIIDWHNLGYSILQLKYSKYARLIQFAKSHERAMGRKAHYHFTVTKAMQAFLKQEFGIDATVLYDRPPNLFQPASWAAKHELLERLDPIIGANSIGSCLKAWLPESVPVETGEVTTICEVERTLLTQREADGAPEPRQPRPALAVTSTSWTPDEDFSLLLGAALDYDAAASAPGAAKEYPDLVFVITGRGPQRDMYLQSLRALLLQRVAVCSVWLEPEDYPSMLACADLGVCLHTSSSGLDLPMKVVDMFGCGLPVCAVDYACITELIQPEATGLLFKTSKELSGHLLQLLKGFPGTSEGQLQQLQKGVAASQLNWRWQDNWEKVASPVFAEAVASRPGNGKKGKGAAGRAKAE